MDWRVAREEAGRLDSAVTQSKVTGGGGRTPIGVEDRLLPAWRAAGVGGGDRASLTGELGDPAGQAILKISSG